jgi:hypothetical protein
VTPLAALLAHLAREGFRLEALGGHIALRPRDRLTPELRDEIIRNRADVLELLRIHGPNLLALFADAPTWPPACGRSGPVAGDWWRVVGDPVRLRDGRQGFLRFAEYDTRSGRLRCYVEPEGAEGGLFDPEDVDILPAVVETAQRKENL